MSKDKPQLLIEFHRVYLRVHLEEVSKLIEKFIQQLDTPEPFFGNGEKWGWQEVYYPQVEMDREENHIIHRHMRSRQLWHRYAQWKNGKEEVYRFISEIRAIATEQYREIVAANHKWKLHDNFCGVALWHAFNVACGGKQQASYNKPDNGSTGLQYESFKIELACSSEEERQAIETEHRSLTKSITKLQGMDELVRVWNDVNSCTEQIAGLARKILRGNDILHPCSYCKRHWV
jgi:hypothetical protein